MAHTLQCMRLWDQRSHRLVWEQVQALEQEQEQELDQGLDLDPHTSHHNLSHKLCRQHWARLGIAQYRRQVIHQGNLMALVKAPEKDLVLGANKSGNHRGLLHYH